MMVTRPLNSRHLSQKGAALSIVFIWAYSLALTTPPLMGWGNYVNEAANISCSVNWHEQSMNTLTYILFLFALGQIVPLSIITFSYVNIIRTMKKNSQRLGRVSRAEARATSMVLIMIISFTVAWTPYSLFALMEQFATEGIVSISPGAGVIPALVAKSSICYDPLIYVGMNTQFRQSIKRLFGIHKRSSGTDKPFNNTVMSPAHKVSAVHDVTTRYNSSETNQSIIVRKKKFADEDSAQYENETNAYQKLELCIIQENKTGSDAERSGETIYEEDSSNNKKQLDVFGDCQLLELESPVITILDSETMLFRKHSVTNTVDKNLYNKSYGNEAYENHASDKVNINKTQIDNQKSIKHSYSLDIVTSSNEPKKRKISIEAKLEGVFKDTIVTQLCDSDTMQGQETIKTFLCTQEAGENT